MEGDSTSNGRKCMCRPRSCVHPPMTRTNGKTKDFHFHPSPYRWCCFTVSCICCTRAPELVSPPKSKLLHIDPGNWLQMWRILALLLLLLIAVCGLPQVAYAGKCGYSSVDRSPDFQFDGSCDGVRDVSRPHSVSIDEFGAIGDGKTINTQAFRKAIIHLQSFADKGGAQLYVPPGNWLTGSFNLTSHLTLYLHREAVILGSEDFTDWPIVDPLPSYGRGRELPGGRHHSLIHGENLQDVIITGDNGTIDGQGGMWWDAFRNKSLDYTRPHLVELMWSTGILISNITLKNSPFWTLHPVYCSDVMIQDVTILAPHSSPNTDGIDPDSSTEVCIVNCYISVGDDAVVIKSGWDEYGISYACPASNIVIRGLVAETPTSAGLAIGSEMSGGVSNVYAERLLITNSRRGIRLKTSPGRGGYIVNITVTDVEMHNVTTAIDIESSYGEHPDDNYDPNALPRVQDILINDVVGDQIKIPGDLEGLQDAIFTNIFLSYISLIGTTSNWTCSYVQGFSQAVYPPICSELTDERVPTSMFFTLQDRVDAWRTKPAWRRVGPVQDEGDEVVRRKMLGRGG